jgi:hypothetical protein
MKTIRVSKDFSRDPAGLDYRDGYNNATRFREQFLLPALHQGKVKVELDGVTGYASNFLKEAFGKLTGRGLSYAEIKERLHLVSRDQSYVLEIQQYIDASRFSSTVPDMRAFFICAVINGELHSCVHELEAFMPLDDARRFLVYDFLGRAGYLDDEAWPGWNAVSYGEMVEHMNKLCGEYNWAIRIKP